MKRIYALFRTRLALRLTTIILLFISAVGLLLIAILINVSESREQSVQRERLDELLTTVENTARIACFLNDKNLMEEVAGGLLSSRLVSGVIIRQDDMTLLELRRGPADTLGEMEPLAKPIFSPFNPDEQTCEVVLSPNPAEIERAVVAASRFVAVALGLLLASVGICVITVVVYFVTRPVVGISHRLHEIEAESGEKLAVPHGNEQDEIGQLVTSVNAMIDHLVAAISKERRLRHQREVEERRFRTIFENVETGIFELDRDGRVISANPAFHRLFQLPDGIEPSEQSVAFIELVDDESLTAQMFHDILSAQTGPLQIELALPDGTLKRWVSVLLSPIEEGRLQGVAHDITERKLATDAAEQLAMTDSLTGLGNRLGFERRLDALAKQHRYEPGYGLALLLFDLDRFKAVNDSLGHAAGDRVLQHVGMLLADLVRKSDYVARLGGDEFVVLLDGLDRRELILPILERFLTNVNEPIEVSEAEVVHVGASVGIALLGQDTSSIKSLVDLADRAMYRAKLAGRNTYCFYGDPSQVGGASASGVSTS